jgi:hypothetical protein
MEKEKERDRREGEEDRDERTGKKKKNGIKDVRSFRNKVNKKEKVKRSKILF